MSQASDDEDELLSDDDDSFLRDVAGMAVSVAPPPLASGLEIDGTYRIVRNLGAGGMGTVYLAEDLRQPRSVAIKVLHRAGGAERRFLRETAILSELAHPAIVRYLGRGALDGGAPYLVMEWVDGETLDARLRGVGLTAAEALAVARRIADALGFAHAHEVIHRDVKPSNLIFPDGDPGRATILDFGIARSTTRAGALTETGAIVGTPSYMAPEQVRGARDVGPAADVFALGCVLYECLTGRRAFEGMRLLSVRAKILLFDPPPIERLAPGMPGEVVAAVARMLAKDPAHRPASGAEAAALLATLPTPTDPTRRPRRADPAGAPPGPAAPPVSIVVATSADALDASGPLRTPEELSTLRGTLAGEIRPLGAAVEVLQDGAMIATLAVTSTAAELAHRAAACALAIRRAAPDALIGVATGDASAEAEAALVEALVHHLAKDAMAMVFAGTDASPLPEGAVRVDARTAALLGADHPVVRIRDAHYLVA